MWKGKHHATLGHWAIKSTYVTWKRVMWYREKRNDHWPWSMGEGLNGSNWDFPFGWHFELVLGLGTWNFSHPIMHTHPSCQISIHWNFMWHTYFQFFLFCIALHSNRKIYGCILFDRQGSYFIFAFSLPIKMHVTSNDQCKFIPWCS